MRRVVLIVTMILMGLIVGVGTISTVEAQGNGQTATVNTSALNVRSGPGINNPAIGVAYRGESYPVVQTTRGWTQVQYKGQTGWMSTSYLLISGTATSEGITGPTSGTSTAPTTGSAVPNTSGSAAPSGSSAGGKLVFATSPGGTIYTVNADGTGLKTVGAGLDPAWSPDGTKIAYADWVTPRGIYIMNADGSNKARVGEQSLSKAPTWSPDGTEIAFNFQNGGRLADEEQCFFGFCFTYPKDPFWRIGIVKVASKEFREPPSDIHSFSPTYRSNGEILFDGDGGLRTINPATNDQPVTVAGDARLYDPRECDGAGKIATTYFQHDHWEVYVLNSSGAGLKRLTGSESVLAGPTYDNVAPEWSPDCSQIIFLTNRDGKWRPYIMNADGSNQRPFLPAVMDGLNFQYGYSSDRVFDWTK